MKCGGLHSVNSIGQTTPGTSKVGAHNVMQASLKSMRPARRTSSLFVIGLGLMTALGCAAADSGPAYPDLRFDFALIGDTPYNEMQETNQFPNLMQELNSQSLAFIVHDGDFKSGSTACT